ncbi:hypothetical protein ACN4EG_08175 [Alkalinema pantanalense CENA528]|uniref:hypothetical protein n=1 Tax=Alkalinema pantanalense TaxID=1620705 RepID=UPI003D6EFAFE
MSLAQHYHNVFQRLTGKNSLWKLTALCLAMVISGSIVLFDQINSVNNQVKQLNAKIEKIEQENYQLFDQIVKASKILEQSKDLKQDVLAFSQQLQTLQLDKAQGSQNITDSKSTEKELLEFSKNYNKDLLITVFFALLGTVATIALAVFGINFFANIFSREQDRELVKNAMEKLLNLELRKVYRQQDRFKREQQEQQKIVVAIHHQVNSLNRIIQWLEYELTTITSEMALEGSHLSYPIALQEKSRGICILSNLLQDVEGEKDINNQLKEELKSLCSMLEQLLGEIEKQELSSDDQQRHKKIRRLLVDRVNNYITKASTLDYEEIQVINSRLKELESA